MVRKPTVAGMSRRILKLHNEGVGTRFEERYMQRIEQLERWRAEHERNQAVEAGLASFSKLSYNPVDYTPLMVITPWEQPPKTDYSYLVIDTVKKEEEKYKAPLATRAGIILLLLFILILFPNAVTVWITATIGVAIAVSFYYALLDRKNGLVRARTMAQAEIARLEKVEAERMEKAKVLHQKKEKERLEAIARLLAGDEGAVMLRLDEVLPKMGLPFPINVVIDLYDNIPYIKVWLPPKSVIPKQQSSLTPGSAIQYTEKEMREINKQYMELCAGLLVTILSVAYENVPSFNKGYAAAMTKEGLEDSCLIYLEFDREKLMNMCKANCGIQAIKSGEAVFEYDTTLDLQAVEAQYPASWRELDQKQIKSINIKVFK